MEKKDTPLYADVVLPLARGYYTYRIGEGLKEGLTPGMCVETPLGKNRIYTGVVWKITGQAPAYKTVRTIERVVPGSPVISPVQVKFWEWMADYYMCSRGEVMKAALPSALKPGGFSHEEFLSDVLPPRLVKYISLGPAVADSDELNRVLEKISKRSPRQYRVLMQFLERVPENELFTASIPRTVFGELYAPVKALVGKGILREEERAPETTKDIFRESGLPVLSPAQEQARKEIKENFGRKDVVLLHGITGSGKTEIYQHFIAEELGRGNNVLVLMPEIAMTTQLVARYKRLFGGRVVTYHSSHTDRHRVDSYRKVNSGEKGLLLIGVRSSVFLPSDGFSLIIVDEEHDGSYKNDDFAPRYNARDSAIVLAGMLGAKTLLGSATPSLETYLNAKSGKYGLALLNERYGKTPLPDIIVSDTINAVKRGERKTHFNKLLLDSIGQTLDRKEQVLLFQNRRGYSPYLECAECGHSPGCPHCSVTLTYHKSDGRLKCHYCGYHTPVPRNCPGCGTESYRTQGFGTEKIEEELAAIFPEARIARLDRDTATSLGRYNGIIRSFEEGETDILIGTQMISKGLDFGGVSLAGVLNADNLLRYPDFRASERAFQLLTQVAGRAGRREGKGTVIIQTSEPDNPVIGQVRRGDYEAMARTELEQRKRFNYPPYCRMITITMRHTNRETLIAASEKFAEKARPIFGKRISGPNPPPVDKVRGEYIVMFYLKIEREKPYSRAKLLLQKCIDAVTSLRESRAVIFTCNVDPL